MKKVSIYTTPTCHFCKQAKALFAEHNIEYTNIDVTTDKALADEMISKSGQMGVPVIEIDGQIIVGFNEGKIKELLDIK